MMTGIKQVQTLNRETQQEMRMRWREKQFSRKRNKHLPDDDEVRFTHRSAWRATYSLTASSLIRHTQHLLPWSPARPISISQSLSLSLFHVVPFSSMKHVQLASFISLSVYQLWNRRQDRSSDQHGELTQNLHNLSQETDIETAKNRQCPLFLSFFYFNILLFLFYFQHYSS